MKRLLVLALGLAGVFACSTTKYQPQTLEVRDPGPPLRVLPTVRVLDQGLTPRAPIRYRVRPDAVEVLYLELAQAQAMQAGSQAAQSGLPPVQLQVKLGPASPTPQGFIRHPVQITQVRISEMAEKMSAAQREQMEQTFAPLLQVRGWSEMDVQGRVRRAEFEGMDGVPPDLITLLGNVRTALLSVPFPDEPLGVRARWEVERKVQFSGIWADQVVTYHIEKIDGEILGLQITARQTAPPQALGQGRLEAYQASVLGSAVVRLEHFTPFSEAESTSQMRIKRQTPTGPQMMRVERRTAVRLYPEQGADAMVVGEPEEEPDPEDAKVLTDPGKQKLKWFNPEG